MKELKQCLENLNRLMEEEGPETNSNAILDEIVQFYADNFRVRKFEVALFSSNPDKTILSFVYPEYMLHSGSIPVNSDEAIVATIFRTGRSILENNLQHRTHLAVFHMIKVPDMGILPLWKLMGTVIKVKDEKIGVIEISRRSPTFAESGKDFTFAERDLLISSIEEFAPFIQKVMQKP